MDFSLVIDEVALEGLDGITVNALWQRLQTRPDFAECMGEDLDEDSKKFIWQYLVSVKNLEFYTLPKPRPELVIFRYSDHVSSDGCKCILPENIPEDNYSRKVIDENGIRGCCDFYSSRINVTDEIRSPNGQALLSLSEILNRWGQKLVIVASQKQRNLALLNSTVCPSGVGPEVYSLLEAIGRARYDGEVTSCRYARGLSSPKFKNLSQTKNVFGKVKFLQHQGYVKKQVFVIKYLNMTPNQVRLIHLRRFFTITRANYRGQLQALTTYLQARPNFCAPYQDVIRDLKLKAEMFKKRRRRFLDYVTSEVVNYTDVYPSSSVSDWKTKSGVERRIRLLRLVRPYNDSDEFDDDDDDDDEDEEEEAVEEEENMSVDDGDNDGGEKTEEDVDDKNEEMDTDKELEKKKPTIESGFLSCRRSVLSQIKIIIDDRGERGVTERELITMTNLEHNIMRNLVKELIKTNNATQVRRASGKNNIAVLVSLEAAKKLETAMQMKLEEKNEKDDDEMEATDSDGADESVTPPQETEMTEAEISQLEEELDSKLKDINVICTVDRTKVVQKAKSTKLENERKLTRKKSILKKLAKEKVYHSTHSLCTEISMAEKKQGQKETMCRKSFKRILQELYHQGLLYYVNISFKQTPEKVIQQMVVEGNTDLSDYKVKKALLFVRSHFMRLKYKAAVNANTKAKPTPKRKYVSPAASASSQSSTATSSPGPSKSTSKTGQNSSMVSVCQILDKSLSPSSDEPQDRQGPAQGKNRRLYGVLTKFERAEKLHKYVFYLLFGYQGRVDSDPEKSPSDQPVVYLDVDDWRRHIPPLKKHNVAHLTEASTSDGVCMIGDLLLNMPVSVFCEILSITWEVPGLREILDSPDSKHMPISHLPHQVLSPMLIKRRYLFKLTDNLQTMCQLGLLTFGPRTNTREMEFWVLCVHKRAKLLDTRNSLPGSMMTHCPEGQEFKTIRYHFQSMDEVTRYWNDLRIIGMNSNLGSHSVEDIPGNHGKVSLMEACKPVQLSQVDDTDWLPGDHRGGAGLDSSVFVHRMSNWNWQGAPDKRKRSITASVVSTDIPGHFASAPEVKKESAAGPPAKMRKGKMKSAGHAVGMAKIRAMEDKKKKPRKHKPLKPKKEKHHTLDDKDKQAKLNMKKIRCTFTPLENGMLLLFHMTCCMLTPGLSNQCVQSHVLRDILHAQLPESKDKTKHAIKGRMTRLLNDKKFRVHLANHISQAKSDEKLMAKYTGRKPTIHSPAMEKLFRSLFEDLRIKFRSPKHSQGLQLPASLADLEEKYEIKSTMDILYSSPKVKGDVKSEHDIMTMVVWELLESFLHLTSPLPGLSVHFTLSRYPDDVIRNAYSYLRSMGIMTLLKRADKDKGQILTNTALLNNHKCMLRHKDALKTRRVPTELFDCIKGQMEALIQAKLKKKDNNSPTSTTNSGRKGGSLGKGVEKSGQDLTQGPSTSSADIEGSTTSQAMGGQKENEAEPVKQEDHIELDLNRFQAGSVLTVLTLMYLEVVTAKARIPDEMVKLDEEGKRKLSYKEPMSAQERKRKIEALMDSGDESSEEWPSPDKESETFKSRRSGQRMGTRQLKYPRQDPGVTDQEAGTSDKDVNQPSTSATVVEGSSDPSQKVMKLKNITLSVKDIRSCASGILGNFTVWVASGSLLTLARTSLIERLDLLTSKCLLQRNFIVEPLDIKYSLKSSGATGSKIGVTTEGPGTGDKIESQNQNQSSAGQASLSVQQKQIESQASDVELERDGKTLIDGFVDIELYKDLIGQLEKCFSEDMDREDVSKILDRSLASDLLEEGRDLHQMIDSFGVIGILEQELETKMSKSIKQLKPILDLLVKADAAFKVGSVQRRFVTRKYAKSWLVKVPCSERGQRIAGPSGGGDLTSGQSGVRTETKMYQCKLWRNFDGSLNVKGLQTIFQRVMTYLWEHPNCSVSGLCDVLNPDVLPVTVLDTLDILEEIGCIDVIQVEKASKPSLFSTRQRGKAPRENLRLHECVRCVTVHMESPIRLAYFFDTAANHSQGRKDRG